MSGLQTRIPAFYSSEKQAAALAVCWLLAYNTSIANQRAFPHPHGARSLSRAVARRSGALRRVHWSPLMTTEKEARVAREVADLALVGAG